MPSRNRINDRIFIGIFFMFLVFNLALSGLTISITKRAERERFETQNIVKSFECILLIKPEHRNVQNVADCHGRKD